MEDKRKILREEHPFSWKILKDGRAFIFWENKNIKTISGKELSKFERLLDLGDDYQIQLFLAKNTGNFKHGNERR